MGLYNGEKRPMHAAEYEPAVTLTTQAPTKRHVPTLLPNSYFHGMVLSASVWYELLEVAFPESADTNTMGETRGEYRETH